MAERRRPPYFIKLFNPSLTSHLKLPSKFVKHIEEKTSGTVSLVGPSGNTWQADLIHRNGCLYIYNGWDAFIRDHFIESGDTLVFRYDGNLIFNIQIFDQSSCEKETAFSAECYQDLSIFDKHFGKKREREFASLLDDVIGGVPKKVRSAQDYSEDINKYQEASEVVDKRACVIDVEPINQRFEATGFLNGSRNSGSPVPDSFPSHLHMLAENSELSPDFCKENEFDTSGRMAVLSPSEADEITKSFTSSFPHFSLVMKRFNVSGSYTLNIPYQFATAYLPKCRVKIVLYNLKGESWTVNSIPTTRAQTSHTFCGGWLSFVRGNNISVGDTCIFELVHECEFRVRVLRVRQEGSDCESGKLKSPAAALKAPGHLTKKVREKSRKTKQLTDIQGQDVAFSVEKVKLGIADKDSTVSSQPRTCNGKPNTRKRNIKDKNGSHTLGCMSLKSAPEEKIAAESFISSFPHFVRVMKKFNISGSYTLKVPCQFSIEHLPDCRTEIVLRNLRGEGWTVNSVPTTKVQVLHTFCGGWMAFVRDNDIKMGDVCIFELVGKFEMLVHISTLGRNGQDCQNGEPSNELSIGSLISNRPLLLDA